MDFCKLPLPNSLRYVIINWAKIDVTKTIITKTGMTGKGESYET